MLIHSHRPLCSAGAKARKTGPLRNAKNSTPRCIRFTRTANRADERPTDEGDSAPSPATQPGFGDGRVGIRLQRRLADQRQPLAGMVIFDQPVVTRPRNWSVLACLDPRPPPSAPLLHAAHKLLSRTFQWPGAVPVLSNAHTFDGYSSAADLFGRGPVWGAPGSLHASSTSPPRP